METCESDHDPHKSIMQRLHEAVGFDVFLSASTFLQLDVAVHETLVTEQTGCGGTSTPGHLDVVLWDAGGCLV